MNNNNNGRKKRELTGDFVDVEECSRRNVIETFSYLHFLHDSNDEWCYQESLEKFNQLLNNSGNCQEQEMLF